jgi:2,3-bisphosphoglycerate-dependent phosphoglycerate mutase
MSDLFCAATLLLAGTTEVDPDPAASTGSLSVKGRDQARELGRSLRDARLAMVYCSAAPPAVQTAEIVAAELGLMVRVRDDLPAELDTMVDLHRGETVLVVGHGDTLVTALPHLVSNLPPDFSPTRPLEPGELVEVAADADGWVVRSWGGQPR